MSLAIPRAPEVARTEGGYLLQYELYVTNWYDKNITIKAVEILAADVLVKTVDESPLSGAAMRRLLFFIAVPR
jgi:hypothetical protein